MRTEEQIVYELLNILYGGKVSNDDYASERLVRSFLRKHRASKINTYYSEGAIIEDVCFQKLENVQFEIVKDLDYKASIPAIVNFKQNFGIRIIKDGYSIPVVRKEAFELSKKNIINKTTPKATIFGNTALIYVGSNDLCNFLEASEKEVLVNSFQEQIAEFDDVAKITADLEVVLYDPDSDPTYDWTTTPYPAPSEIIDQLTTSTLARDLGLLIREKADTLINNKKDNTSFDDTIGVR